jgi:hypothetical protein
LKKQRERPPSRRKIARAVRRIREFFSSLPSFRNLEFPDDLEGGLGVREPRRPVPPSLSGAAALDVPPDETRDVWAVGDDSRT